MPKGAAIRFSVHPRDVPSKKAARRLHLTLHEFENLKNALFDRGFPRPDQTTGMYDLVAIDDWMDRRNRLGAETGLTSEREPRNAQEVFGDRVRRILDGQG